MKETIANRLEEAGVGSDRLIDVVDGDKRSVDHTHLPPEGISGNYGVHATATDNLVILDVDDYKGLEDKSGLSALTDLPTTLEETTPHGGTHRFYTVPPSEDGRFVAAVLKDEFNAESEKSKGNLDPSWGEVRVANQYVVAAGSQLDGCDKDECDACAMDAGGKYEIRADREIAELDVETLVDVLSRDPKLSEGDDSETEEEEEPEPDVDTSDLETDEVLTYALEESDDEKLQRLWRGDYSDYGGDRSEAESALAYKLAWWLQGDKHAVRQAMDRADTKKWSEREDDSYRESVLEAVDSCSDYYNPSESPAEQSVPTYDEEQVERGETLLNAECTPSNPAGDMVERNGHYGYMYETTNDDGQYVRKFDMVTNFKLETLEHLKTDDSELLKIRVHPTHPMGETYEVDVHPTVFNETRAFKEEIVRGKTTRYEPGGRNQQALNDLRETVGSQMVPTRTGVEHIGLAGDDHSEWVSPKGTFDADGEAEDPEHRYYAKGGSSESEGGALARKWNLEAEKVGDYDSDDVARILELLPRTRRHDRGLPILGWFYSAPLRPLIHDWEGEFNLLQVVGTTGTGKTSTLKAYWEAFGMDPDPFSASDTPFTLMKHMSSSRGVPVWIDEYKPADIRNDRLDTLHRRLREVTKGTAVSKGRANLGEVLFQIEAPVVVSGEQKFSQSVPAVRRRSIMTTLSKDPTEPGSSYTRAFARLTGTAYEDDGGGVNYPDGFDLTDHASAYYEFILSQEADKLEEMWNSARVDTGDLLSQRDLKLQPTEFQGAQTILFGVRLFRKFAKTVDADMSVLPTDDDVADAFDHFAQNIGKDGQRRGYDDSFLELFAQAAAADYVKKGEDYRFVESQKWGENVLAFHMPSVYAGVKRYVRDFNLGDEYNVIGKTDYLSAFKDKAGDGSYMLKIGHKVRLDDGPTKCVVIEPEKTHQKLGPDFELRAFGAVDDGKDENAELDKDSDGESSPYDADRIADTASSLTGYVTVTAEIATTDRLGEGEQGVKAVLHDTSDVIDLVSWDEEIGKEIERLEGETVVIEKAEVTEFNGTPQLSPVSGLTGIGRIQPGVGYAPEEKTPEGVKRLEGSENTTSDAATDGGDTEEADSSPADTTQLKKRVKDVLRTEYGPGADVSVGGVAGGLKEDPSAVEEVLDNLATETSILKETEDGYRRLS